MTSGVPTVAGPSDSPLSNCCSHRFSVARPPHWPETA